MKPRVLYLVSCYENGWDIDLAEKVKLMHGYQHCFASLKRFSVLRTFDNSVLIGNKVLGLIKMLDAHIQSSEKSISFSF